MNIDNVHKIIRTRILKDQQGYITPEEIDLILDAEQISYFSSLFGTPTGQSAGRPQSVIGTGQNQRISDALLPFLQTVFYNDEDYHPTTNPFGTGPEGIIVFPENFMHFSSLSFSPVGSFSLVTTEFFEASLPGAEQIFNFATLPGRIYRINLENSDGTVYAGETHLRYNDLEGGAEVVIHSGGSVNSSGTYFFSTEDKDGRFSVSPTTDLTVKVYIKSISHEWDDVELLADDQFSNRVSSALLAPSSDEPIATMLQIGGYSNNEEIPSGRYTIQMHPREGYSLRLRYFRRPLAPQFVYTLASRTGGSGGARFVYDSANSTQLEWKQTSIDHIIERAIRSLSVSIQDPNAYQDSVNQDQLPK